MSRFLERLASGPPIVADGGMGALIASAVPRLRCPEEANLRAPESVLDVHLGYIRAGAELIETNTFGANRPKLAEHFLEDELEQIASAGVVPQQPPMIPAPSARACAANSPKYAGVACGNTIRLPDMLASPTFGSTASTRSSPLMSLSARSAAAGPAP